MINRVKRFLAGIAGVLVGMIVASVFRNGDMDWDTISVLITVPFLILLFILGMNLYKK